MGAAPFGSLHGRLLILLHLLLWSDEETLPFADLAQLRITQNINRAHIVQPCFKFARLINL